MIVSSGHTGVWIDFSDNKPGMNLQCLDRLAGKGGFSYSVGEWKDYLKDGKPVKSPVDIDSLPPLALLLNIDLKVSVLIVSSG